MTGDPISFLRIGLFGGGFNPPHIAHVLAVAWALAGGEIDQVWIIPTNGHPFGKKLEPFPERMEMCRRAFALFGEKTRLLDIEREPVVHYSIETLRQLAREYPESRWRWIMGSDTLADAAQWRQFDEIMRLAPSIIIPRAGHGCEAKEKRSGLSNPAEGGKFSLPDLSSTYLRQRLSSGNLSGLEVFIPRSVLDWIKQRGLYREKIAP